MRFSSACCLCKDPSAHFFSNKDQNAKNARAARENKKARKTCIDKHLLTFCIKENPAEPCTPQKKTLHSKAVSAALLCASNVRCGRAAREACIPTERYRIPFNNCRFRYGCVSRAKQEKVSKALLSVYAYARDLCAQFSLLSPSASSS